MWFPRSQPKKPPDVAVVERRVVVHDRIAMLLMVYRPRLSKELNAKSLWANSPADAL